MKQIISVLFLMISISSYSQEDDKSPKFQIDVGGIYHMNNLNEDNYLDNKAPWGLGGPRSLIGIDLRFTIPSKLKNLDIVFGSIIEKCMDEYDSTTDYLLNGGGVYIGVSPKLKTKYFGLTSMLGIGAFSYKEYFSFYRTTPPVADIYEKKSSFGLGAVSSVGLYAKLGPVGVNPQVQAVFSGGSNGSFLFYGIVLPVTITF